MQIFRGHSEVADGRLAVAEATKEWDIGETALDMIFAFCSTKQDATVVAAELQSKFPGARIAGCTTAGEYLDGQHFNGSLVVAGIRSPGIRWRTTRVEGLAACDEAKARAAADRLFESFGVARDDVDPTHFFGLILLDGMSMREEVVSALVANELEGVPLLGGSAGDDLQFAKTLVIEGSTAVSDAFVLVLAETQLPYKMLKHQHFLATSHTLAITRADVAQRRVYEMDGVPAAEAYARALGLTRAELTDSITFSNPLTFSCNGELYVRSIQKVHDDDSISLFCALEEGMVLDVGGPEDMLSAFQRDIQGLTTGDTKVDLVIGCNCILRSLEAGERRLHDGLGAALGSVARCEIGFDTYGEVMHGLHINQTFVGVALCG